MIFMLFLLVKISKYLKNSGYVHIFESIVHYTEKITQIVEINVIKI